MARDPYSPVPDVSPSGPAGQYQNIAPSAAAFGGLQGQAEQNVGRGIEQTGETLDQVALRMQDFNNVRDAREANMGFMASLGQQYAKYATLEGKAAVDGLVPFQQQMEDTLQKTAATLKSPMAQNDFLSNARFSMSRMLNSASVYAAQQQKKSWIEGNTASIDAVTQHSILMQNDPLTIALGEHQIVAAAHDNAMHLGMEGDEAEGLTRSTVGKYYQSVITAKMLTPESQGGGATAAAALFNDVKDKMDTKSILEVEQRLHPILKSQQADAVFQSILSGASPAAGAPSGPSPNNIGNVKTAAGAAAGTGDFVQPSSPEEGVVLTVNNLRNGYQGMTIAQIGEKWEGTTPDKIANWVSTVSRTSGLSPDAVPDMNNPEQLATLVQGIGTAEKSQGDLTRFTSDVIRQGVQLAVSGKASQASPNMPDWSALETKALAATEGDDETRRTVLSKLGQVRSQMELATATERATLEHQQDDLQQALLAGLPAPIPVDRIRAVFQPQEADRRIAALKVAQNAGQILTQFKWASPDQIDKATLDLTSGTGILSDTLRNKLGREKGATTVTSPAGPGQAEPVVETAEAFGLRHRVINMAVQYLDERRKALLADAGGYVATEPTVAAAAKAMDPQKPDTYGDFARTTLAVQDHLGVAPALQHVLPMARAQDMAAQLMAPGLDVKQQMEGLEKQWGTAWPHVFSDMVTLGKLPAAYQSVAVLDDPKDAALQARAIADQTKSQKTWDDILTPKAAADIRNTIRNDTNVQQLLRSMANSGASRQMVYNAQGSIEQFAFAKKFYEQDPYPATSAVRAFTSKYVFLPNGDARIPRDKAPTVTSNAAYTLNGPALDTIPLPPGFREDGDADAARQHPTWPTRQDYLTAIRANPTWVTRGDALWLLDSQARVVRGADGKPVSVPFSAPLMVPDYEHILGDFTP